MNSMPQPKASEMNAKPNAHAAPRLRKAWKMLARKKGHDGQDRQPGAISGAEEHPHDLAEDGDERERPRQVGDPARGTSTPIRMRAGVDTDAHAPESRVACVVARADIIGPAARAEAAS